MSNIVMSENNPEDFQDWTVNPRFIEVKKVKPDWVQISILWRAPGDTQWKQKVMRITHAELFILQDRITEVVDEIEGNV